MKGKLVDVKVGAILGAVLLLVAAAVCLAVWGGGAQPGSGPLPKEESLAQEDPAGVAPAAGARPSAEALAEFQDVLHVQDATGAQLVLDDVPEGDYRGFLFKLDPRAAVEQAAKVDEAVDRGLLRFVAADLYEVESLDALAGLFGSDDVSLVEPNFTLHLVGDVEGEDLLTAQEGPERDAAQAALAAQEADSAPTAAADSQADAPAAAAAGATDAVQAVAAQVAPASGDAARASAATSQPLVDVLGGTDRNPAPDYPPNDQNYAAGKLWHLDMLNVQGAWELGLDGDPYVYNNTPVRDSDVRVAVIDTGLYGTGASETPHEDFDYGKVDVGYDWIHADSQHAPDAKGHGTFVAGLIGARVNNEGVGVAGLMPGTVIVPEKVFDTGSATTANVISAIYHAAGYYNDVAGFDHVDPVDVINMSLGGEYNEETLEEACQYAVDQGILVVASAGNDGVSTPNYPAAYDCVVGVASVNSAKARSSWSQYGISAFVTAPGESVTSTYNEGPTSYTTASGTSFSGPEVAALAAMCKSVYPDITQDVFMDFLVQTSDPLEGMTRGEWNQYFGYGLVNFESMANVVLASQTLPWYNLRFDVTDEQGRAIEGATVSLAAAEDVEWGADDEAHPPFAAGSLAAGAKVDPAEEGLFTVHRGSYTYTVEAPGYYTCTGTVRTISENQSVQVAMPAAFETTVSVVDSSGQAVEGATLAVSSDRRVEQPKQEQGSVRTFDLASGVYSFEASAEGYEDSRGQFRVGFAPAAFQVVLYRSDELAQVEFAFSDAETSAELTRGVAVSVADDQGMTPSPQADGTYRLAKGKSYTATASKVGYENASETFTVKDDGQVVALALTPAQNRVTFALRDAATGQAPAGGAVKVTEARTGAAVDPRTQGGLVFGLPQGEYTYEATAPGYAARQGSFGVATDSFTLTVDLQPHEQQVTFNVTDAADGSPVQGAAVKVSTASTRATIPASDDGAWLLTPGDYRYTVYKEGYAVAQGSFSVGGGALVVDVALSARQAGETTFAGGSGTQDDPYLIATEGQLRYLAESTEIVRMTDSSAPTNVCRTLTGYYRLIDDIELTAEWYPIGNEESSSNYFRFGGTFDGGGHTVSNVRIDQPALDYQGFFGSVAGATITDLTVEGPGIVGKSYVGGLVGRAYYYYSSGYPQYNLDPTTIERCGNRLDVTGKYAVAGMIGSAQATNDDNAGQWVDPGTGGGISVSECFNTGNIAASEGGEFGRSCSSAGGIVGSAQQIAVTDCYNTGSVQAGYNAGGILGNSRLCSVSTSYSTGFVAQYVKASGYEGTQGGIAGNAYYTFMTDCYYLKRAESGVNAQYGTTDSASTYVNCHGREHADAYRTAQFVAEMNHNSTTSTDGTAFRLGRDYPLLHWQAAAGALLAPAPVVVEQPQGMEPRDAYKVGAAATRLEARAEVGEPDGEGMTSTVTWAWYAADDASGRNAHPVAGATGTGLHASFVPPTDEVGTAFYLCAFTNSVSTENASDEATARTSAAAVYVRSATDAQQPVLAKLNPTRTSNVNTALTVKQGTDAILSVEAEVGDGGELSYQWYESVAGSTGPSAIDGATGAAYAADTSALGTRYYYVGVTNTLEVGNQSTAMSERIAVTVVPYTIDSYEDLVAFRTAVNGGRSFAGVAVTLTDDIRIPDGVDWTPIGTPDNPFSGLFMGGSGYASTPDPTRVTVHTVSNLSIDGDAHGNSFLGLFGYTRDAQLFDLQVQGSITGTANTYAGLLVGYASTYNTSSSYAYIENCVALAGSSVQGKYLLGGLVGASGSNMNNCSNHASVQALPFPREKAPTTAGYWSVGGVVGYCAGTGEMMGCYNTGSVGVAALDAENDPTNDYCAEYLGGVAGFVGANSGLYSSFNAGPVAAGTRAPDALTYRGKVRYAGAVAGYISYGASNCRNLHYLEGTFDTGANDDTGGGLASMHSRAYFKTDYFVNELATGYAGYKPSHFVRSDDGVPHYAWEAQNHDPESDGKLHAAEPHMIDVIAKDMPRITSTWKGTYYVNGLANPIYLLAESVDGGTLSFRWQVRDMSYASQGFDDGWEDIPGTDESLWVAVGTGDPVDEGYAGEKALAGRFTVPVDCEQTLQYRCVVRNELAGTPEGDEPMESATDPITVEVRDAAYALYLERPNEPNGPDNPWIVDTPVRLKFLSDVVAGNELLPGLDDSSFKGQYVRMDADIDLSGYDNWQPIGTYSETSRQACFQGVFDGGHHKVTGLKIDRQGTAVLDYAPWYPEDYTGVGLFGGTYLATVRNLEVAGSVYLDNWRYTSTTSQAWMTGGVIGYAWGTRVENVVNRASVAGWQDAGGVVGRAENCRLFNCENLGEVTVNESAMKSSYMGVCIGGVVGNLVQTSAGAGSGAGLYNCYDGGTVAGRVTSDGDYRFGAVVGEVDESTVANCFYVQGAAVVKGGTGRTPTGVGGGNNARQPGADVEGRTMPVAAGQGGATAWKLNTAGVADLGVSSGHSARWGFFAREDLGESEAQVHLVGADAAKAVYCVDCASEAAVVEASPAYAPAGTQVEVSWAAKDGFAVDSVSWSASGSDPVGLGTGDQGSASFTMPAADVAIGVAAQRDDRHRYAVTARALLDGAPAGPEVGSVELSASSVAAETPVTVQVSCAEGYQVKSVSACDAYGQSVAVTRTAGLSYEVAVASADVEVTVAFEPYGTPADAQAPSLAVDHAATHAFSSDARFATADALFETVAFSGTWLGRDVPVMVHELERAGTPGLYTQRYTFADGEARTFTGVDVAAYLRALGSGDVPDDALVTFECADGKVRQYTFADLSSLGYASYDADGQPLERGLPVLLFFGADGTPNAAGTGVGLVFGQLAPGDDNASRILAGVKRVSVGDDVSYSMHDWSATQGSQTIDFADMDQISGGTTDAGEGQSTLHVRVYRGQAAPENLVSDSSITLPEVEALARLDRAGIWRGYQSTYVYEDRTDSTGGPYTDYIEGYDLYKVLQRCGVTAVPGAQVQFYQTGLNGLANSRKTVAVSLDYLAGNGPDGVGDYSGNFMRFAGDDGAAVSSGTLTGLRPLLVYGKNSLPLVWSSGTDGVSPSAYNWRGPMMAFLPQNSSEGGDYVPKATVTSCYLGLIDVYLPEDTPLAAYDLDVAVDAAEGALASGVVASADGNDVLSTDRWVPQDVAQALRDAVERAKEVRSDPASTDEQLTASQEELAAAVASFHAAEKAGSLFGGGLVAGASLRTVASPESGAAFAYDGTEHVGVQPGEGYEVTGGDASAVEAGLYTAYVKPVAGRVWPNGSSGAIAVSWQIDRAPVAKPTARAGLVYNGARQVAVAAAEGFGVTDGSAVAAGSYTARAVLDSNHCWADGSTADLRLAWTMGKCSQKIALPRTSFALRFGAKAFSLQARTNGDGAISYSSSNKKVATVSATGKVTLKGVGKATITVRAKATGNSTASAAKKVTLRVAKGVNPLKVKASAKSVSFAKVAKSNRTVKALAVRGAKGKVAAKIVAINGKKVAKSALRAKFGVAKSGKVTVRKGTPRGTYKLKVRVRAKGTGTYKAKTVTKTVRIRVK